jgi:methyl coenzyme M reductase system subunit A2
MTAWDVDILHADEAADRAISRRVAIMIQRTFALYGDDRVIENVMHALEDINYPQGQLVSRAADLIDQVKLSHRMMHIARDLSGGEKQRVVLARQLAKEPMMLLADEPTGTLDPKTAEVVHHNIKALSKDTGITILITSHFPEVIEEMATRAILLENGKIKTMGAPHDVIRAFIGDEKAVEKKVVETGSPVIRVKDLSKKYFSVDRGVINAVNNVSFDIKEGEIFGIVGVSGAGKTSLMSIITGNLEPTVGWWRCAWARTGSTCASPAISPGAAQSRTSACCTRNTTSIRIGRSSTT